MKPVAPPTPALRHAAAQHRGALDVRSAQDMLFVTSGRAQPATPHAWGRLRATCHSSSTGMSAWLCSAMPPVFQRASETERACCMPLGVRQGAQHRPGALRQQKAIAPVCRPPCPASQQHPRWRDGLPHLYAGWCQQRRQARGRHPRCWGRMTSQKPSQTCQSHHRSPCGCAKGSLLRCWCCARAQRSTARALYHTAQQSALTWRPRCRWRAGTPEGCCG